MRNTNPGTQAGSLAIDEADAGIQCREHSEAALETCMARGK
jgi:hypothetical protein